MARHKNRSFTTNQALSSEVAVQREQEIPQNKPVEKKLEDSVLFKGSGIFFPVINGVRQKVKLDHFSGFTYRAVGKDMIAWCDERFERVQRDKAE